jgi:hypothetical protein
MLRHIARAHMMNRMPHFEVLASHGRVRVLALLLLLPVAVHGATIAVGCSSNQLISAITAANSTPEPDVLQLAAACTYSFTAPDNTWYGPNALPPIASDITIEGNGATLLISGPVPARFFYVSGGLSPAHGGPDVPAGTLTLRNLTLNSGKALGGGSDFGGGGAGMGGAIFNQGTLTLIADTLVGNQAIGGSTVNSPSRYGGGGMGADASGSNGGGFGQFIGGYGGIGGPGTANASGGGGGFSADGASGILGANTGGGNSGWGGSGFFGASGRGDAGGGAGAGPGGNGGNFGTGGASGVFAGGGGGVGGGGGGGGSNGYGGGGGFGGGGGGGFYPATGGFGGGGSSGGAAGGYGGGSGGSVGNGGGAGAGMGGAIFNLNGTVSIINSTLTGNQAIGGTSSVGGGNGAGLGGAIFNLQGGVDIRYSTLAYNFASVNGGALYNLGYLAGDDGGKLQTVSTVTLASSILSNSSGAVSISDLTTDAPATLAAGNANIAIASTTLDSTSIVTRMQSLGNSTIVGTPITIDPNLGPLQNNGGPTMTLALTSTSAAIDAGSSAGAPATDQRGCQRPVGVAPDIGAYESSYIADLVFRDGFEGTATCQ